MSGRRSHDGPERVASRAGGLPSPLPKPHVTGDKTLTDATLRLAPQGGEDPLRVLFVSSVSTAAGGAERSLLELARALRARGCHVALATWAPGELAAEFEALGLTFVLGRSGDPASPLGGITTDLPPLRPLIALANRVRLALRPVGREARWLVDTASRVGADILHTNCDLSTPATARAARTTGVPWVAHVRDLTRSWLHPRTAGALATADRVVAPSTFLALRYQAHGLDVEVIPNPVSDGELRRPLPPAETVRIRTELGLSADRFLVGVVGRLDEQKGTLDVVEAARRLGGCGDEGRRVEFVLAGAGSASFEAGLRTALEAAGVADRVRLLGHRDDVPHWLPALDALMAPSRAEGFGRVIVEGMAAGLPVVAYRDGATPELVEDGRTGVLVQPEDAGALAVALASLAADPDRARRLGAAGREAAARFAPARVAESMEQLYHRVLER